MFNIIKKLINNVEEYKLVIVYRYMIENLNLELSRDLFIAGFIYIYLKFINSIGKISK